jgi:hypothetical protein
MGGHPIWVVGGAGAEGGGVIGREGLPHLGLYIIGVWWWWFFGGGGGER